MVPFSLKGWNLCTEVIQRFFPLGFVLLLIKKHFKIFFFFHIVVFTGCKQAPILSPFSVRSPVNTAEDFHCEAFYFMLFLIAITKCGCWIRTKHWYIHHKDIGLFPLLVPPFMQPQIATLLFATTLNYKSKLSCFSTLWNYLPPPLTQEISNTCTVLVI